MTTKAPAVFGVNMSLYTASDELVTSASTQALLRSWGVPLIRVPLRSSLSDAELTRAMQAVLAVGATPMLILRGPKTGTLAVNQDLLGLITNVFGNQRVYLEYGNEADLDGVNADAYTAGWNQVIPALKQAAPAEYKFVGPVNFQFNPAYAATFAKNAHPEPDYLSWHEYVCNSGNPESYCMEHIANWGAHANAVNNAARTAVGHTIPFFISEWNLDPNDTPRYGNPAFIQAWTRSAASQLNELTAVGLVGAMIYTATDHGNFGVIDQGRLTPQGTTFRDLMTAGAAPPTTSLSATAVPTGTTQPTSRAGPTRSASGSPSAGPTSPPRSTAATTPGTGGGSIARTSFEHGMDGWAEYWGYDKLTLSRTSSVHYDGEYALMLRGAGTGYMAAGTQAGLAGLGAGSRITFQVYSDGSGSGSVRPFVMDSGYTVHFPQNQTPLPTSARWFAVTFTVPAGVSVLAIGLQLASNATNTSVAIDGLAWPV